MSEKEPLVILRNELAWSRMGVAQVRFGQCQRCLAGAPCLAVDTSDGEYGEALLCLPCIQEGFTHYLAQP